jgi:Cytotoxic
MITRPRRLKAFPFAKRARPKTYMMRGGLRYRWIDRYTGTLYEWDYQHGHVEVYDRLGRHLGEFDPDSGEQLQPADPQRRIIPLEVLIVGYGLDDRVAWEAPVAKRRIAKARTLAHVPDDDRDLALAYPLTEAAARALSPDVPPGLAYFLEGATD